MALAMIFLLLLLLAALIAMPFAVFSNNWEEITAYFYSSNNYLYSLILVFYGATSLFLVRMYFYKTNSLEIFFFMLFLSTMFFESARTFILVLEHFDAPRTFLMFFSRTAFFGKIFGTTSLFISALFSSDIEIKKLDTPIIAIIILSFLLSSSMPLSDNILQNSYFRPGFFINFILAFIFIDFLTLLVFIINYFQKKNLEYLYLAVSILFIVTGRELSFYFVSYQAFMAGLILLVSGTALFSIKLHGIYKWY